MTIWTAPEASRSFRMIGSCVAQSRGFSVGGSTRARVPSIELIREDGNDVVRMKAARADAQGLRAQRRQAAAIQRVEAEVITQKVGGIGEVFLPADGAVPEIRCVLIEEVG